VDLILHDQRAILTVCTPVQDVMAVPDVTLALPNLVGGNGVVGTFLQPLSQLEEQLLCNSAHVVKAAIDSLALG
jgi:L-lactate dehydrogenase